MKRETLAFSYVRRDGIRIDERFWSPYIELHSTGEYEFQAWKFRAKKVANDTRIIFSFSENSWWQNHAENNICICPTRQKKMCGSDIQYHPRRINSNLSLGRINTIERTGINISNAFVPSWSPNPGERRSISSLNCGAPRKSADIYRNNQELIHRFEPWNVMSPNCPIIARRGEDRGGITWTPGRGEIYWRGVHAIKTSY